MGSHMMRHGVRACILLCTILSYVFGPLFFGQMVVRLRSAAGLTEHSR